MTQEEKNLLLKDLCSRLLYDPIVYVDENLPRLKLGTATRVWEYIGVDKPCKPYLRPMSSMTEEEDKEYAKVIVKSQDCSLENSESATTMANDWLLSKGFDVRGLISKGLAIEAPEGMYEY
jgi:hypothetical protein